MPLVGEESLRLDERQQCASLRDIMDLPARQADRKWVSQSIDDGVDFRREPTGRAAYGLVTEN